MEEKDQSFFTLTLELPLMPVFKDKSAKITIPQVSISELLKKFDGTTF